MNGQWLAVVSGVPPPKGMPHTYPHGTVSQQLSTDQRYRVLAESAPDAIVTIDSRGILLSVNPATERIFGYSGEELVGQSISILMPERMREAHANGMARYLRTGERHVDWQGVQLPGLTRDGREFPMEISFGEFVEGGRHVFSGFMRDTSERTAQRALIDRTSAELRTALAALEDRMRETEQARRAADDANIAKVRFLQTMSHELRTPLNAIGGFVDLLEMGVRGPVTDAQREDLGRISAAQKRLLTLINDVLDFARLEEGQVHFDRKPVRVAAVLARLESLIEPQLRAKSIAYRCDAGPEELVVIADEQGVEHVLTNLLSNAVKFTPQEGRIDVEASTSDGTLRLTVRDTGPGIPPDQLGAIFEPFVQIDSTLTRVHEGTGLGLSISQDLARGMGGEITVESVVGQGTAFTLSLPLKR